MCYPWRLRAHILWPPFLGNFAHSNLLFGIAKGVLQHRNYTVYPQVQKQQMTKLPQSMKKSAFQVIIIPEKDGRLYSLDVDS